MKHLKALLATVAAATALGLCAPTQAATISNFNQNPADGGLSAAGGVLNIASVDIDYTFQVPPNNTAPAVPPFPSGTVPASLDVTSASPISVVSLGGGIYGATGVVLSFTIVGTNRDVTSPPSPFNGKNLLSGNLLATITVDTNANSITLQGIGSSWTSGVQYNVGGGPVYANLLYGQTFSMSLLNLASITVDGSNHLNFTSHNGTPGGSSITGNFAAVPEPASLVLMGLGLAGIPGVVALRKRAARA